MQAAGPQRKALRPGVPENTFCQASQGVQRNPQGVTQPREYLPVHVDAGQHVEGIPEGARPQVLSAAWTGSQGHRHPFSFATCSFGRGQPWAGCPPRAQAEVSQKALRPAHVLDLDHITGFIPSPDLCPMGEDGR